MDWLAAGQCLLSLAPTHHPAMHWLAAEQMDWLAARQCLLSLAPTHNPSEHWPAAEQIDWLAAWGGVFQPGSYPPSYQALANR
jgi:hypothetical protein